MVEVPLSIEAEALLSELARKTGVTTEEFARRAILERMEDIEDTLLAEERHRTRNGVTISLDDITARYSGKK